MKYPETPELDKLSAVQPETGAMSTFIDYIEEPGLAICYVDPCVNGVRYYPTSRTNSSLIAGALDIDEVKVEAERQAILDAIATEARL